MADNRPITPDVWREVTGTNEAYDFPTKPGDPEKSLLWCAENSSVYACVDGMYSRLPNVRTAGDLRELLRLLGEASQ